MCFHYQPYGYLVHIDLCLTVSITICSILLYGFAIKFTINLSSIIKTRIID